MTRGISVKVFRQKETAERKAPVSDTSLLKKLINVDLAVVESARIDGDGSLIVAVRPRKSRLCRCRECGKKAPVCVQSIAFRQKMQHGFVTSRAGLLIRFLFQPMPPRHDPWRHRCPALGYGAPSPFRLPEHQRRIHAAARPVELYEPPVVHDAVDQDADFVDANCTKHTRA